MAYASTTPTARTGETLGQMINRWAAEFGAWTERRKVYRTTFSELSRLTDRDLRDLGLIRADIRRVAMEAAYGK